MKLNTIAIAGLAAGIFVGGAMGQDATSTTTSTTSTTSTYAAPTYSAPSPVSAPRTGLYTSVTQANAAADNTVDDYTRRPTLIGNRQYATGSFNLAKTASSNVSFEGNGLNWFGGVYSRFARPDSNRIQPAELRFGVGSGSAWGGGLILSFDKKTVQAAGSETKDVIEGDGFGLFGDINLGSSDVYGQVALYTGFDGVPPLNNNYQEVNYAVGPTQETNNYLINIMAGWKKDATTEGTHALNLEIVYNVSKNEDKTPPLPRIENSLNHLALTFAHGYILRATPDYSVFIGSNTLFDYGALNTESTPKDHNNITLSFTPNVAFQKQLGKGFEGFSGVSVTTSYTFADNESATVLERTAVLTGNASLSAGLRWVKDNFAFEGSLNNPVLLNGPYLFGGVANQGLLSAIGLSIGF